MQAWPWFPWIVTLAALAIFIVLQLICLNLRRLRRLRNALARVAPAPSGRAFAIYSHNLSDEEEHDDGFRVPRAKEGVRWMTNGTLEWLPNLAPAPAEPSRSRVQPPLPAEVSEEVAAIEAAAATRLQSRVRGNQARNAVWQGSHRMAPKLEPVSTLTPNLLAPQLAPLGGARTPEATMLQAMHQAHWSGEFVHVHEEG